MSSVTVDGVTVTECETVYADGMAYRDGEKIWTYSFKAETQGNIVCNITVADADGETAIITSPELKVNKLNVIERIMELIKKLIALWRSLF